MKLRRILLVSLAPMVLAGCAGWNLQNASAPLSREALNEAVAAALEDAGTKDVNATVSKLEHLAQRNPASGLPWSHIAKMRFEKEQYGPAIVAADEALQRDPDDIYAKSVRVVGGLRVAMQSLADIKGNAILAGSARTDAQALAAAMRDVLGQDVLFPGGRRPAAQTNNRPATSPTGSHADAPSTTGQPALPSTVRNPFETLLQN